MVGVVSSIYVGLNDRILTDKGFVLASTLKSSIIHTYNGKDFSNSYVKDKLYNVGCKKILCNNYIPFELGFDSIINNEKSVLYINKKTKILNFPFTSISGTKKQKNVDMFTQGAYSFFGGKFRNIRYMRANEDVLNHLQLLDYSSINYSKLNKDRIIMFFKHPYIEHSVPFGFSRPDKGAFLSGYMFFNSSLSNRKKLIIKYKKVWSWDRFKLLLNECGIDYDIKNKDVYIDKHFFYGFKNKNIFLRGIEHKKYDKFVYNVKRNVVSIENVMSDVIEIKRTDFICINGIFI